MIENSSIWCSSQMSWTWLLDISAPVHRCSTLCTPWSFHQLNPLILFKVRGGLKKVGFLCPKYTPNMPLSLYVTKNLNILVCFLFGIESLLYKIGGTVNYFFAISILPNVALFTPSRQQKSHFWIHIDITTFTLQRQN